MAAVLATGVVVGVVSTVVVVKALKKVKLPKGGWEADVATAAVFYGLADATCQVAKSLVGRGKLRSGPPGNLINF